MMKKGQAFSVFQLLISAIVAFAILYILLTIIPTGGFVGRDPTSVAKDLIGDRLKYPGSPKDSDVLRFSKGSNIAARAVAKDTGITAKQIAICKGDFEDNEDFKFKGDESAGTHWLTYDGTPIDAKIRVVCDRGDMIGSIVDASGGNWEACKIGSDCTEGRTCCAIILMFR